jgi:hypothetical protein
MLCLRVARKIDILHDITETAYPKLNRIIVKTDIMGVILELSKAPSSAA